MKDQELLKTERENVRMLKIKSTISNDILVKQKLILKS